MEIGRVVVFGANGFQGLPQVKLAAASGYRTRAVSRNVQRFVAAEYRGVETVAADYEDAGSLREAFADVDAMFFQAPALGDTDRLARQLDNLIAAATDAGVKLAIINSSMWAPDNPPCGEPVYDGVAAMEQRFVCSGIPYVIFRPTLFMNNLQGHWVKEQIIDGVYPYCHHADMKADWICLEDVAKFMVAALGRPDLIGRKIRIGGPQRLTTLQMLEILSDVIGRSIEHQWISPREFGESFWRTFGHTTGLEREAFISDVDSFYTFNNFAPQKPFECNSGAAVELIPVELTSMRTWAEAQDWCRPN